MKTFFNLTLLAFLFSCQADEELVKAETDNTLSFIRISSSYGVQTPWKSFLDVNETTRLSVVGFNSNRDTIGVDSEVTWAVDTSHVSISNEGTVTAHTRGSVVVSATVNDSIIGWYEIQVWDSLNPKQEIYVSYARANGGPPYQIVKYDDDGMNPEILANNDLFWPQDLLFLENQPPYLLVVSRYQAGIQFKRPYRSGFSGGFGYELSEPSRVKLGVDGLLYVLQWSGRANVVRYSTTGEFIDDFTEIGIPQASGLDWDNNGNLYVSSFNDGVDGFIRKFDPEGQDLGLVISQGLQGPTDIWFVQNGDLMILDQTAGNLIQYDMQERTMSAVITDLNRPQGVSILHDGSYLIDDASDGTIKLFSSTFNFVKDIVPRNDFALTNPDVLVVATAIFVTTLSE